MQPKVTWTLVGVRKDGTSYRLRTRGKMTTLAPIMLDMNRRKTEGWSGFNVCSDNTAERLPALAAILPGDTFTDAATARDTLSIMGAVTVKKGGNWHLTGDDRNVRGASKAFEALGIIDVPTGMKATSFIPGRIPTE
jgi:hypothetical protein